MLLAIDSLNNITRFISLLIIFAFVLAITYFTTRYIANYQKGKIDNGNIKIIETARISQDKLLQIIKVGTRYFLIAISKNDVTYLSELKEDEIKISENGTNSLPGFSDLLEIAKGKTSKKVDSGDNASLNNKLKKFDLTVDEHDINED